MEMKELLPYIVDQLERSNQRYEVHHFPSGAIMVDIWIADLVHVIQIDGDTIGLSQNTDETLWFDIIPDRSFKNDDEFKDAFQSILP